MKVTGKIGRIEEAWKCGEHNYSTGEIPGQEVTWYVTVIMSYVALMVVRLGKWAWWLHGRDFTEDAVLEQNGGMSHSQLLRSTITTQYVWCVIYYSYSLYRVLWTQYYI